VATQLSEWPQSIARTVVCKAYLASDHISPATGKTIALKISKNHAAFGDPSAGATNLTEISNGWYYWTSSTTDTGTIGPVIGRGTEGTIDDVEFFFDVVDANKGNLANLDAAISSRSTYAGGAVASVTGDVGGKVLGGGASALSGVGVQADVEQWKGGTPDALSSGKLPADVKLWLATAPAALTASGYLQVALLRWLTDNAAGTPNALSSGLVDAILSAAGAFAQGAADKVWATAARALTDKAGFALTAAYDPAKTAAQAGDAMALTVGERNSLYARLFQQAMTEGYAALGAAPTAEQFFFMLLQGLVEFSIAGTTITVKKLDRATTAETFTLDDGTNPTSRTRAS
jgi:hypothetical protein